MSVMSVVVTGASGMLGSAVLGRFGGSTRATGWRLRGDGSEPSLRQVDIADADAVDAAFDDLAPTLCVHCAAIADVDRCEAEPELAEAVNVRGTANVAAAAARHGARMILISSDYVFDGRAEASYLEDAEPNPLQVYGASKRAAELAVLELEDCLVVRLPLLYRVDADGWFQRTWSHLLAREEIRADALQVRQPALVDDVAELIVALAELPEKGIAHIAPRQHETRHGWARLIAAALGAPLDLVLATELRPEVPRPQRASLATERIEALGLEPPRSASAVIAAQLPTV
jgi:dTDP-4-dehydrorhamnose reductase